MDRHLTLEHISDELLAEYGLRRGGATRPSYRSSDPNAVLISLAEIGGPQARNLNEQAIRDLLRGIRDDAPIPPVVVFREPGAATATLLDGLHRWRLSQALGYIAIPTTQPSREDAEVRYRGSCGEGNRVPVNSEGKKLNLEGKKSMSDNGE